MIKNRIALNGKAFGKSEIELLAKVFAKQISKGDLILLEGAVGAGKTFFSRAIINARCVMDNLQVEEVPSPTFSLVQDYYLKSFSILHLDLYRLKNQADLIELGIPDIFYDHVTLVEWPNLIDKVLPPRFMVFSIFQNKHCQELRDVELKFFGDGWENFYQSPYVENFFSNQSSLIKQED